MSSTNCRSSTISASELQVTMVASHRSKIFVHNTLVLYEYFLILRFVCTSMATSSRKRQCLRRYKDEFLLFGFQPAQAESTGRPECVECGTLLTNDSMKSSKLLAHQKAKHPSSIGKDVSYFQLLAKKHKENIPMKL